MCRFHCGWAEGMIPSERSIDYVLQFLRRNRDVDGERPRAGRPWIRRFESDRWETTLDLWYEVHKGAQESLREF